MQQNNNNKTLIEIEEDLKNILYNERLTTEICNRFKEQLVLYKKLFGMSLSKEFFLSDVREHKNLINTRLGRIIKKAEIPISNRIGFFKGFANKKGVCFTCKYAKIFHIFGV